MSDGRSLCAPAVSEHRRSHQLVVVGNTLGVTSLSLWKELQAHMKTVSSSQYC